MGKKKVASQLTAAETLAAAGLKGGHKKGGKKGRKIGRSKRSPAMANYLAQGREAKNRARRIAKNDTWQAECKRARRLAPHATGIQRLVRHMRAR